MATEVAPEIERLISKLESRTILATISLTSMVKKNILEDED